MWMGHVPHVNESCLSKKFKQHKSARVKWMSHVTRLNKSFLPLSLGKTKRPNSVSVSTCACDMTPSDVCHDTFRWVVWLVHMCDILHWCAWHDSFTCMTKEIQMNGKTRSNNIYMHMYVYIHIHTYTYMYTCMYIYI